MATPREFEFIPVWNIPVLFSYTMRRVDCPQCGVKVEAVPWAQGKHSCCDAYRHFLATWARRLSSSKSRRAPFSHAIGRVSLSIALCCHI